MNDSPSHDRASQGGFSAAFEQMCNFVAVSKTGDPEATVLGLVQLCFTILPDEPLSTGHQVVEAIATVFGVNVSLGDTERALEKLHREHTLSSDVNGRYSLNPAARAEIQNRIDDATSLESRIKSAWIEEVNSEFPDLQSDKAWAALKGYLFLAFRRHGLQSASLLDPEFPVDPNHETSLASLLRQSVAAHFTVTEQQNAERAVAGFLAELGQDADRAKYITQLADAAFNFYTLEVPPEISATLRTRLRDLTLFLDTNFLFGILDLHYNSQADVSHDLIRAIAVHKLPFRLRFHEATHDEMRRTITGLSAHLRSRQWPRSLSRAASQTRQLTGIEQKFHERNAVQVIDIDEFLRPIEHCDAVLAEKGIKIYRPTGSRLSERTDLYHDYKDFLEKNGRPDKTYETIQHDATVLDATWLLRTNAKSSLDAGALLVTCDYLLYKFDREVSRRTGKLPCVVLPNMFWQLLRPFLTTDTDFERSFAETFALPEFRAIGSGGAKACSKMMSILATYKDVPEQTAFHLMTDGMLIKRLQNASSDEEFAKVVELAIVEENRSLLEETTSLRQAVAEQAEEKKRAEEAKRKLEEDAENAQKSALAELERERGKAADLQSQLDSIEETKQRRRTLLTYSAWLCVLIALSGATSWLVAGFFPWWERVLGRTILIGVFAVPLFVLCHLAFEWCTRENSRLGALLPFVLVRQFRAWLWSFVVFSFVAGVIGNLVANRIQTKIDQLEPESHESSQPASESSNE